MVNEEAPQGRSPLLVLGKIRSILESFAPETPELTLPQIRQRTGLPASTCQRLVQNLLHEGFLDRSGDGYRIGLSLVRMAAAGVHGFDPLRQVQPFLDELRDGTGETACLYVRDGLRQSVVELAETRHAVKRTVALGMTAPLHADSAGKVFLAYDDTAWHEAREAGLPPVTGQTAKGQTVAGQTGTNAAELDRQREAVRRQGYAESFEELDPGCGSVSAPVFGVHGELVAVLGVVAPVQRLSPADVPELAARVVAAAADASRAIGGSAAAREEAGTSAEAAGVDACRVAQPADAEACVAQQPAISGELCATGTAPSGATWGPVSHALFRAGRLHRVLAGNLLRRAGLYPGQEILLMLLWDEDDRPQADLIRALALDASTVTKMLQRLQQAGFVTRTPSPTDRRASIVSLTEAGRALQGQVAELWGELEQGSVRLLTAEETSTATRLLGRIEQGLSQATGSPAGPAGGSSGGAASAG
ncbi:IclR family transcriptional regulator domain-containing protein [Streptomyces cavernicola]|uniref:IclR family transcriptional regulator C-terminal domain-containing protein n=1 Tax=Streptomyces cavernicola TaxID=3043613 RepID=A0ABT6SAB9_9ACTN|nr:IclR family transcriptional regulator C-terminal domain-containing protein [Streptomyces sp. B-S-A6]MDI3405136.1 IclR family transcriptional regulator C-terminal domain-containing protein [Streptomyces sp. B-S-A6]